MNEREIGCDNCGKVVLESDGIWWNNGKHPHDPDCVGGFVCNVCVEKEGQR